VTMSPPGTFAASTAMQQFRQLYRGTTDVELIALGGANPRRCKIATGGTRLLFVPFHGEGTHGNDRDRGIAARPGSALICRVASHSRRAQAAGCP